MRFKWFIGVITAMLGVVFGHSGGGLAHAAPALQLSDLIANTSSYGVYATSDLANLRSGPTANTSVSCTSRAPVSRINSVGAADLSAIGNVGAVKTTTGTSQTATTKTARATSTVGGVDLLDGLITSDALVTTSTVTVDTEGVATSKATAKLAGLKVGGVEVSAYPAPNTTISLKVGSAVIGKVVLNQQVKRTATGSGEAMARALVVEITAGNSLGLSVGTRLIVGHTSSALKVSPAGVIDGEGFTVRATTLDGAVKSGPHSLAAVPCMGGSRTASAAALDLPGLVKTGAVKTDAVGTVTSSSSARVVSTLSGVSLLGGLASVDAITASTSATRSSAGSPVQTTNDSKIANLRIAGLPVVNGTVQPNTVLRIPGVATLTLNKVTKTSTGITVVMLEIKLEKLLGSLPTGSVLELGYSRTNIA